MKKAQLMAAEMALDHAHNELAAALNEQRRIILLPDPSTEDLVRLDHLRIFVTEMKNIKIPAARIVVEKMVKEANAEAIPMKTNDFSIC